MSTVKERYAPNIENIPYLTMPLRGNFSITEGFIYSQEERNIHGNYFHKGIDYATPYGTPVYASASGYAVSGYHRFTALNDDNTLKLYQGLPLGNGLGYFIQIYHPYSVCKVKGGRITQYGHLSKFGKGIKAKNYWPLKIDFESEIRRKNSNLKINKVSERVLEKKIQKTKELLKQYQWTKKIYGYSFRKRENKRELYTYSLKEIKKMYKKGNRFIKWVEQGDLIGYTGSSAIVWGDLKYRENCRRPNVKEFETWDEVHLHFQEATRDSKTLLKKDQRDPYGIYLSKEHYRKRVRNNTLFINDRQRKLWE
jgi:hypothetical protein